MKSGKYERESCFVYGKLKQKIAFDFDIKKNQCVTGFSFRSEIINVGILTIEKIQD